MKKYHKILILILIVTLINIYLAINVVTAHRNLNDRILTVEFLDVGQGDAILITTPDQKRVLIDSSSTEIVTRALSDSLLYLDKKIDLIISTHADLDHIGGTPFLIKKYKSDDFAYNFDLESSSLTREIKTRLQKDKIDLIILKAGDRIVLDSENQIYLEILWPHPDFSDKDKNENSIITQLVYGEVEFMLTGDAGKEVENHLINLYDPEKLKSKVFKLGHHGSDTSTVSEFLEVVEPVYAVVSAGKDNKFGHPHEEVIYRVEKFVEPQNILQTKNGPVIFHTDGRSLWVDKSVNSN